MNTAESSPHLPQLEKGQVNVKVKVTQSCLTLCNPMDCPWDSPGQNAGMGSLSLLLQGIFPAQGSNPGLPHRRWILYQLRHKGSPRILEWVAMPSSRILYLVVYISEKAKAPHSSTLAGRIPWMEEPGGLQSMRSLRVGHD